MSGAFLYFFPGLTEREFTREWLRSSPVSEPLRDIWERGEGWRLNHHATVNNGPDGKSGLLIAAGVPEEQTAIYQKDHQDWRNVGTHYIGVDRRHVPNAASLARRRMIPGVEMELAAGGVWVLPIIRQPDPATLRPTVSNLPLVHTGGDGVKMPERYQQVWELTGKLFDWLVWEVPLAESKADSGRILFDAAATILGVNYRVGPHEIGILECLEEDDEVAVIQAAIDMASVEAIVNERKGKGANANPSVALA